MDPSYWAHHIGQKMLNHGVLLSNHLSESITQIELDYTAANAPPAGSHVDVRLCRLPLSDCCTVTFQWNGSATIALPVGHACTQVGKASTDLERVSDIQVLRQRNNHML